MELHQQFGTLLENFLQHPAKIYKSKMTEEEVKVLPSNSTSKANRDDLFCRIL